MFTYHLLGDAYREYDNPKIRRLAEARVYELWVEACLPSRISI